MSSDKPFKLSDYIVNVSNGQVFRGDGVKEFIKKLKDEVVLLMGAYNVTKHEEDILNSVKETIDKLAGEELI